MLGLLEGRSAREDGATCAMRSVHECPGDVA